MPVRRHAAIYVAMITIVVGACADEAVLSTSSRQAQFSVATGDLVPIVDPAGGTQAFFASLNNHIGLRGGQYAVREASLLLARSANPHRASIVFANDRQRRLGYRFVKNDPRRTPVGTALRQSSFPIFAFAPTGTSFVDSKPLIDASFASWSAVKCARLSIVSNPLPFGVFPSAMLDLGGYAENPLVSDINTLGFLPGGVFDWVFGPGASTQVVAATFPYVFLDGAGNPTDIDGDQNDDLAFAEIWYNSSFTWTNTGTGPNIDIETAALHENGHALGLGHFGKISFNLSNGKLHVSPRAVMNAAVIDTQRSPLGPDTGSFCSNWANWK